MEKSIFEYRDYKRYLNGALETSGATRGRRSRLAGTLNCQTAFISQVLNGATHFSLEHAILINDFLEHTKEEKHYFMLLVQLGRAGSETLKRYYGEQIQHIHDGRQVIRERIQVKQSLSIQDQMTYYSSWIYAAIHIMLSVPKFQTKVMIADHLKLPVNIVSDCLNFLASAGLAIQEKGKYKIGSTRIHLGKESPILSKHHANWRVQAIQALDKRSIEDLHYSSVISLSEEDAVRIKTLLLSTLEKTEPILRESKEEAVFCFSTDFFRL